ncbi:MAG: flagellar hook-associated protein FlgK [Leptospiraceae bacterium]|nr:flagellar hook-associated protein FlgK [Leptospiraceae bacterium]MDW8307347.1 flagellar hook-associated protein FlgK [Leptospiraceae bacterium]
MPSTFMGLEIAKRGITSHQKAIETTGHNISNADNKNFARQRVKLEAMHPIYEPSLNRAHGPGMLGQGAKVGEIERIRDHFVDQRILATEQSAAYWEIRQKYLHHTEIIFNEPSEESLRTQLDRLWQAWQELSQYPEEMSHRELVRTRGREFAFRMRETFQRLFELRQQVDFELTVTVNRLNEMAEEVRELNEKILKSQTLGDNPNDLLDRRDALLQEMAKLADISVERQDPNELIVYLGGQVLVQGESRRKLVVVGDPQNEGLSRVVWEFSGQDVLFRNGKIQSLMDVRDGILKENIQKLDLLAVNIHDIVNEVHRDGFGLTKETNINFFRLDNLSRNVRGNFDLNGDGIDEITAIFKVAGRNPLIADRPVGVGGTLTFYRNDQENTPVYITYRPDETLKSIIDRINRSGAGVVAYLNHNNNLVLKGTLAEDDWRTNFMIRHIEDSGELLVGFAGILQNSGPAGAFDYRRIDEINKLQSDLERITHTPVFHPAGSLRLSDAVEGNIALIAAATGKDVGGTGDLNQAHGLKDGTNALRIAQALRHRETMVGTHRTSDEFYNAVVAKIGIETRTAKDQVENQAAIMKNLENIRQSIMGVNLDEEMANLVQFQHGYNAAARVMQAINELIERLIELF